jgi:hypothetical protein
VDYSESDNQIRTIPECFKEEEEESKNPNANEIIEESEVSSDIRRGFEGVNEQM